MSSRIPFAFLIASALAFVGPVQIRAQPPVSVQPGDMLRITVWKDADLSGDFSVAPDSTLVHPIYNRLKIVGTPVATLERVVLDFLRTFHSDPQVEIEPLFRVVVGGEVRAPSAYFLDPTKTVGDAIAEAGGASAEGNLSSVMVERAGQQRRLDVTRTGEGAADQRVRSGDRIVVARRRNILRDYVGPLFSVAATVVSLLTLSRR